ncbi:MAG TPA: glycoside hydrolase family 3 N-terminal domain-containing protein, partial [Thermoanaerobaculia bacterium]|nr:glycoside hydrolase family 3 N-terminal domain-containing protein [Thermoanaerobaculia bacterium]
MTAGCATSTRTIPPVEDLTLEEKVGQMIVPGGHGIFLNETSPAWKRLEREVRELRVGGFIWFVSNVYETALLTERLQRMSRIPLLISADLEAGMGMRFLDTTFWPPSMALAATGDPSLAERQGANVAREARAIGINHILAPVVDVNVDPDNPVINARSYGEDPERVGEFAAAFIRGVRSEGVLTTAKHFPGHGDTHVDSHRSLPVLEVDRARLEKVELVPFRKAIEAGVDSVMIGHLSVPALDSTPAPRLAGGERHNPYVAGESEAPEEATLPATLSHPIIEGLLRRDLGFQGLVISDAFDMGGLTEHFDPGEAAVRGIEAGEDQILMSPNVPKAVEAVIEAVRAGRLPMERIDRSVGRILDAKRRVAFDVADTDEIFRLVDSEESRKVAGEIAQRAITLVRDGGTLPLRRDQRVALVIVTDSAEALNPLSQLEKQLKERLGVATRTWFVDSRSGEAEIAAIRTGAAEADVVLFALAIRARSGAGRLAMPDAAKRLIESWPGRSVVVSFGTPYILREIPSATTYLCAYGPQPVLQTAAARALFGEAPIGGMLP